MVFRGFILKLTCESFPSRTGGSPRAGISGQTPDLWSCILKVGSSTILMTATAFTFIFPISERKNKAKEKPIKSSLVFKAEIPNLTDDTI